MKQIVLHLNIADSDVSFARGKLQNCIDDMQNPANFDRIFIQSFEIETYSDLPDRVQEEIIWQNAKMRCIPEGRIARYFEPITHDEWTALLANKKLASQFVCAKQRASDQMVIVKYLA